MKRGVTKSQVQSKAKEAGSSTTSTAENNINSRDEFNMLSPALSTRSRDRLNHRLKTDLPEPEIHRTLSPIHKRRLNGGNNLLRTPGESNISPVFSPLRQNPCIAHTVLTPLQNQSFGNDSLANESFLCALDNVERANLEQNDHCQVHNNLSKAHEFDDSMDHFFEQSFNEQNQLYHSPDHSTPKSSKADLNGSNRILRTDDDGKNCTSVRPEVVQEVKVTSAGLMKSLPSEPAMSTSSDPNELKKKPAKKKGGKRKGKGRFKTAYTNRKDIQILSESGGNELSREDLSALSEEEKLLLSSWGLPESIVSKYRFKGVTSLFPWQLECLSNMKVFEGKNLLYSAPTSAGKTLVAEILMLKRVLELGKKAIMILPFVSVAREKMYSLQELFADAGVRVEGFMGSYNPPGGFKAVDIAICTIEKANSLINRLLTEGSLSQLGTIVVDELHLVGDPNRGYLLELLLTKIKFMSSKNSENKIIYESQNGSPKTSGLNIQIIGMSATLPNLPLLADWLDAELVTTDYRPVPLSEKIKIGDQVYDTSLRLSRLVRQESLLIDIKNDPDNIIYLSLETILEGHSVLIFCPTKAWCEKLAEQMAREFFNIGKPKSDRPPEVGHKLREQLNSVRIAELLEQLKQCPAGKDETLAITAAFGVGFHHAGLTFDERDILESAFKRGVLRVIVATSTLSAGVNLPARRVIIASPVFNGYPLDPLTYKQMSGRAGRKGVDTEGESILICNTGNHDTGIRLIQSSLPSVKSALLGHTGSLTSSMKRALLEVVASGAAKSALEVQNYSKATLLSTANDSEEDPPASQANAKTTVDECLEFLVKNEFIKLVQYEDNDKGDEYLSTQLGSACLASSLSPDEGIVVFKELLRARQCFVLSNELHVIYQVTPIYLSDQWRNLNWHQFLKIYESLSSDEIRVCQQIGVEETFILNAMMSGVSWKNPAQRAKLSIHQRFYTALALNDLVNEMPITTVAAKYEVNKGVIQNLQQAASTFAGMVTAFCSRLGWSNLELLLSQFQDRLQFGVQRELCDLVRLSLVNGQRARILYDAGIQTMADLAAADPAQIEQIFHKAGPFSSNVHGKSDESRTVYVLGKLQALTETEMAQLIVKEARQFLQIELKLETVQFAGTGSGNENLPIENVNNESNELLAPVNTAVAQTDEGNSNNGEFLTAINTVASFGNNLVISEAVNTNVDAYGGQNNNDEIEIEDILSELSYSLVRDLDDREREEPNRSRTRNVVILDPTSPVPVTVVNLDSDSDATVSHIGSANSSAEMFEESGPLLDDLEYIERNSISGTRPHTCVENNPFNGQNNSCLNPDLHREMDGNMNDDGDNYKQIEEVSPSADIELDKDISFMDMSLNSVHLTDDDGIPTEFFIGRRKQEGDSKESASLFGTSSSSSEMFEQSNHSSSSVEIFPTATKETDLPQAVEGSIPTINSKKTKNPFSPEPHPNCSSSSDGVDEEHILPSVLPEDIRNSNVTKYGSLLSKDKVVKIQLLHDIKNLPGDLLIKGVAVSLCLKIKEPKKVLSYTRCRIGAKIMRRSRSKACSSSKQDAYCGQTKSDNNYEYTLTFYSGGETVWMYTWMSSMRGSKPRESCVIEIFLNQILNAGCPIILLSAQAKVRNLTKHFGQHLLDKLLACSEKIWDPKIAGWLCQESDDELDNSDTWICVERLMDFHLDGEERVAVIESLNWPYEAKESYISWVFMRKLKIILEDCLLWGHFTTVEMPSILPVVSMEINGFCFNVAEFERLQKVLKLKAALLELKAYKIVGRQFNMSSTKDLDKVLFCELKLIRPPKTRGTGKEVLLKLEHIVASIIIEYRKVHHALQLIFPYSQAQNPKTGRIHGIYKHLSITGRIIMAEPSIQFIPRDFDMKISFTREEIDSLRSDTTIVGSKVSTLLSIVDDGLTMENERRLDHGLGSQGNSSFITIENLDSISMRNAFCSRSEDFVLVSADYSQLELRILAILSEDSNLIKTLNSGQDVFKAIASGWKKIPLSQVTTSLRQEAKSIVYAIIYGMGKNSLSEKMNVSVDTAADYIEQFMKSYSGVRSFITSTIKSCKQKGYVQTILGRRRFLPNINSLKQSLKSQAERQAVNSRVQGSASDLVRKSMIRVHTMMTALALEVSSNVSPSGTLAANNKLPCYMVLNLHDELIFEVKKDCVIDFVPRLRDAMEKPLTLPVHVALPVNIKIGSTWGSLELHET